MGIGVSIFLIAVGAILTWAVNASVSGLELDPDIRGTGVPHAEIDRQYLDPTAIRTELGWEPKWDFDSGLSATWSWYERVLSSG